MGSSSGVCSFTSVGWVGGHMSHCCECQVLEKRHKALKLLKLSFVVLFTRSTFTWKNNKKKKSWCLSSVLMAQAVPSEPPALCWYGNRLPDFTSRAAPQHFVLAIYACWFKISVELSSLLPLPLWTFKVNLFFFLQSRQVISFPVAFLSGSFPSVQHTPLRRGIDNAWLVYFSHAKCLQLLDH